MLSPAFDYRLLRRRTSSAVRRTVNRLADHWAPFVDSGRRFDTSFWPWLEPVNVDETEWVQRGLPPQEEMPWSPSTLEDDPTTVAASCKGETGFYPISFCYPAPSTPPIAEKTQLISAVIPGMPYSFRTPGDYFAEYQRSHYALTFRKAGWDCFRHVEILAAGAIPLMVDVLAVPKYSMVHYPKKLMSEVVSHLRISGDAPSAEISSAFSRHYQDHLTCRAMAAYILTQAGIERAEKVLFVDPRLPLQPDYQSMLTLIGLKQLLGVQCIAMPEVPYLYSDWRGLTDSLYGRGFGYSRVLDASLRTPRRGHLRTALKKVLRQRRFDALIIGSVARNGPIAFDLLEEFPPEKTIWIHGEDSPPSPREQHYLRSSRTHVFVRSMPTINGGLPQPGGLSRKAVPE